jgi:hypothetical protein
MRSFTMGCLALSVSAGCANAALFSFASDRNQDGPTFSAIALNAVNDGRGLDADGAVTVDLLADRDGNGPMGAQVIAGRFEFAATITNYAVANFAGQFIHNFTLSGAFSIIDNSTNAAIFTATFQNALFSSFSNTANQLGRSGQIQSNDAADPALGFTTAGALADIDVSAERSFGFSLSDLQLSNGNRVPVSATGITNVPWTSEGSFSAAAASVPSTGSAALMVLGLMTAARRRRA